MRTIVLRLIANCMLVDDVCNLEGSSPLTRHPSRDADKYSDKLTAEERVLEHLESRSRPKGSNTSCLIYLLTT